jgi:ABC-type glycerol-3-phosphate transport system substrate-binding protein
MLRIVVSLMVFMLGGAAVAQSTARDSANLNAWQSLSKLSPSERKVVIEREARREGPLVLYGATGLDRAQFWIAEFNKRYPDVKVEFVRLQAAELYQKIATERRTGCRPILSSRPSYRLAEGRRRACAVRDANGKTSIRVSGWVALTRADRVV